MLAFVCRVHADRLHGSQWEEIKGNSAGSKARLQLIAILSTILADIYDHGRDHENRSCDHGVGNNELWLGELL